MTVTAKPLDVDNVLGKIKNRVARIGVELEGGWKELPPGVNLDADGSVFRGNYDLLAQYPARDKSGELPIGPIQPAALASYMTKYYPHKVDHTCGMHVHLSFKHLLHYQWLQVPEYQETLIKYLTNWAKAGNFPPKHHIWGRLSGNNQFCLKAFWPDMQISKKSKEFGRDGEGHRYTMVHYCGRLNTIEVRVLPMMQTVEQAIRGVQQVIDITNACLYKLGRNEEKISGKVELSGGDLYEEYTTFV